MRLIPAIDIIDGKCVRLTKGDYSTKKIYNENPLEVAKMFEDSGIKFLHLVDLDGAKAKHIVNHRILEELASKTSLQIDFGGGLKSNEDLKIAFESGANQITGGTIAVTDNDLFNSWISNYGPDKIILGADALNENIATHGWTNSSTIKVHEFISKFVNNNGKYVICTDIDKDGALKGPNIELYKSILTKCPNINLIASGGVAEITDLYNLKEANLEGAIIGKAIYENKISLKEIEHFNLV